MVGGKDNTSTFKRIQHENNTIKFENNANNNVTEFSGITNFLDRCQCFPSFNPKNLPTDFSKSIIDQFMQIMSVLLSYAHFLV